MAELSGGGLDGGVQSSKLSGGSYEDGMNKGAATAVGNKADLEAGAGAGAAASAGVVSSGRPSVRASVRTTTVAQVEAKGLGHQIVWHMKKMDLCTWWLVVLTAVFTLLIYLTP